MTAFIVSLLVLAINVLKFVLVGAIIAGTVVATNKYLFGEEKVDLNLNLDFLKKKEKVVVTCSCCKAAIETTHKFCPYCGTATITSTETVEVTQPNA